MKNRLTLILLLLISMTACGQKKHQKDEVFRPDYAKQELEEFIKQVDAKQVHTIFLPTPQIDGAISIEKALANRRSQRQFQDKAISLENLSQILWAAYGITYPISDLEFLRGGLRTAPSAGGYRLYTI